MIDRLKRGDLVRVRLDDGRDDHWTNAFVEFASDNNPASVMLNLDGVVRASQGALIGLALPLSIDYEAQTITSLMNDYYEIEVADAGTLQRY